MDVIVGPGPVYGFHFTVKLSIAKKSVFRFEAYYGDGLSSFVEVDGSDIKSLDCLDCQPISKTHLATSIDNNDTTPPITTIDFESAIPDGENGWYVNYVEVCLHAMDNLSGVKAIYYRLNCGEWKNHNGEFLYFIVEESREHVVEYYSIDNAGNIEDVKSTTFKMDLEKPIAKCDWSQISKYKVKFTVDAYDENSGINRVEFWWDGKYQYTDYEEPYEWILQISDKKDVATQSFVYPFYVFDNAGWITQPVDNNLISKNTHNILNQQTHSQQFTFLLNLLFLKDFRDVIKFYEEDCIECQSNGKTHLAEKLLNRLEKNEVISNVDDTIKSQDIGVVCFILENLIDKYTELMDYYESLWKENIYTHPILSMIYRNTAVLYALLQNYVIFIWWALEC
jgi:hypothetical protein